MTTTLDRDALESRTNGRTRPNAQNGDRGGTRDGFETAISMPPSTQTAPALSIVTPTRNEAENVIPLLAAIQSALGGGANIEVIFVDDSDDGTPFVVEKANELFPFPVSVVARPPARRNGLGRAVVEGFQAARAPWVCVMDGDLQHPPEVISQLLDKARATGANLVVASRLTKGGSTHGLSFRRKLISYALAGVSRICFMHHVGHVSDPMTGFFLVQRSILNPADLQPEGFKILLEVLIRTPDLRVAEVPFEFGKRQAGESKANLREMLRLSRQMLRLTFISRQHLLRSIMPAYLHRTRGAKKMDTPYFYNIHDIIRVRSAQRLPELRYFATPAPLDRIDIDVHVVPNVDRHRQPDSIAYRDLPGHFGFDIVVNRRAEKTDVFASSLVGHSPHVLYTNVVEPLLRWMFVRKGYALMHGAAISFGGRALFITARTDTGKTTTILRTIRNNAEECRFLSDDMSILSQDGTIRSYPKPLTISQHTVQAIGGAPLSRRERLFLQVQSRLHSREGRRVGMFLNDSQMPAATLNAVVQFLIPPPKFMVDQLIPQARYANLARLDHIVLIERGEDFEKSLPDEAKLDVLIANAEDAYGFPPYPVIAEQLYHWNGVDLRQRERDIVAIAIEDIPAVHLGSSCYDWHQRLPRHVTVPVRSLPKEEPREPSWAHEGERWGVLSGGVSTD